MMKHTVNAKIFENTHSIRLKATSPFVIAYILMSTIGLHGIVGKFFQRRLDLECDAGIKDVTLGLIHGAIPEFRDPPT